MTFHDSASGHEQYSAPGVEALSQVAVDAVYQLGHGPAQVIASHVGVQVLPQSLDPVLVGTVGRQEVEPELGRVGAQPGLRHPPTACGKGTDTSAVAVMPASLC